MAGILVLHGPNLNLLGKREPDLYGHTTLAQINQKLLTMAQQANRSVQFYQSNAEHELIDVIQKAPDEFIGFIIINAAALTHTSIALRDALKSVSIPFIEVHLSNIYQRETYRHHSYLADIAVGVISGFGAMSYELAMRVALETLKD